MFDRRHFKKIAKDQLRNRFATPLFSLLIICGITFILQSGNLLTTLKFSDITFHKQAFSLTSQNITPGFWIQIIQIMLSGILGFAFTRIFVLLFHTTEKIPLAEFFSGLENFVTGALSFLWYTLWVSLWSLLFFIPGIVKAVSYSQMFFILAENPKIGISKAMNLSKVLTRGFKGDLFLMLLSFLPWDLLSCLTGGILQLWIIPYRVMAFTNAYEYLKARAIRIGELTEQDFTGDN